MTITAIHPAGCGCCWPATEAVPLEQATPEHIAGVLTGRILNQSGTDIQITVTAHADGRTWDLTGLYTPPR